MENNKQAIVARQIKSITYLGMAMNIVLSVIKVAIGLLAASLALVADGIHSLSDVATDVAVLLGLRIGSKEPDQSHPYGHGRAETFSAGLVALVLIVVGGAMIYYATFAIARDEMTIPRFGVLIAAVISIAAKEWLYKATQKVAIQSHSPALYANAWHHRSDALSSVAVVIGFISLEFGFGHGDQVAAIAVGLMIIWVGVRVIGDALRELTEAAVDPDTIEHIKNIINSDSSIRQWHKLRTRTVGREVFLDLHILVDPELKITAAHEITERLEKTLDEQITRPINITVHIEPDTPELRK
ncbi:MAG TPA: cation diffusion facilitator family transporter [Sedimentisphaerales bacterium]|nr:cation diffusion facilitator family transporter [Sedimentisphaerales bacterium]